MKQSRQKLLVPSTVNNTEIYDLHLNPQTYRVNQIHHV